MGILWANVIRNRPQWQIAVHESNERSVERCCMVTKMSDFLCQTCGFTGAPPTMRMTAPTDGNPGGFAWHCPNCFAMSHLHDDTKDNPAEQGNSSPPVRAVVKAAAPVPVSQPMDFLAQARNRMSEIRLQLATAEALKAELKMLEKFFGVKSRKTKRTVRKASPRLKAVGS